MRAVAPVRSARLRILSGVLCVVAMVALYFVIPTSTHTAAWRLVGSLAVSATAAVVLVLTMIDQVRHEESRRRLTVRRMALLLEFVAMAFALSYYSLATHLPGEIVGIQTRIDALYFTATTMSTVGYGDVHASGQLARVLVTLNLGFDVFFLAVAGSLLKTALTTRGHQPMSSAAVVPNDRPVPASASTRLDHQA